MILHAEYVCPLMEIGEHWRDNCEGCEWHGFAKDAAKECSLDYLTKGEARNLIGVYRKLNRLEIKAEYLAKDIDYMKGTLEIQKFICEQYTNQRRAEDK